MKKLLVILFLFLFFIFPQRVFAGANIQPQITSIDKSSALPTDTVTITGSNLGGDCNTPTAPQGATLLLINDTQKINPPILAWCNDHIRFKTPDPQANSPTSWRIDIAYIRIGLPAAEAYYDGFIINAPQTIVDVTYSIRCGGNPITGAQVVLTNNTGASFQDTSSDGEGHFDHVSFPNPSSNDLFELDTDISGYPSSANVTGTFLLDSSLIYSGKTQHVDFNFPYCLTVTPTPTPDENANIHIDSISPDGRIEIGPNDTTITINGSGFNSLSDPLYPVFVDSKDGQGNWNYVFFLGLNSIVDWQNDKITAKLNYNDLAWNESPPQGTVTGFIGLASLSHGLSGEIESNTLPASFDIAPHAPMSITGVTPNDITIGPSTNATTINYTWSGHNSTGSTDVIYGGSKLNRGDKLSETNEYFWLSSGSQRNITGPGGNGIIIVDYNSDDKRNVPSGTVQAYFALVSDPPDLELISDSFPVTLHYPTLNPSETPVTSSPSGTPSEAPTPSSPPVATPTPSNLSTGQCVAELAKNVCYVGTCKPNTTCGFDTNCDISNSQWQVDCASFSYCKDASGNSCHEGGKACAYTDPTDGKLHAGNCLDGSQNCSTDVNCGYVPGYSTGEVVTAAPSTTPTPGSGHFSMLKSICNVFGIESNICN